ncbi:MAG: Hsp20/alpha crystallin family protein [Spirochaetota bacterium]
MDAGNRHEGNGQRVERRSGSFQRSIPLPTSVDENRVSAEYRNGVHEIRLPKSEEAKPRQVRINVR